MWTRKVSRSGGNGVVTETGRELVGDYCSKTPSYMTVRDYRTVVSQILNDTRRRLNWTRVGQIEGLDSRRLQLVRDITSSLHGDDFVAYALTELMPTADGRLNTQVLDFLLRNGGREYVEAIPALYDPYTSFGPYQFTQYAWYDVRGDRRGAARVNQALSSPIPHGSTARLRGDEHHMAAFMLAVHNLAYTIRSLNNRQLDTLERVWRRNHGDIIQFIAVAHHAPYGLRGAQGAFQRWLTNNVRLDFSRSLSSRLGMYARKTRANLSATEGV